MPLIEPNPPIQIWRFHMAPQELRALSGNCGDEDWLALVPPSLVEEWIPWLEAGFGRFGTCRVDAYMRPDGSQVRIGSHA